MGNDLIENRAGDVAVFGSGQHAPHSNCGTQSIDTMQAIRDVDCLLQVETVQIKAL